MHDVRERIDDFARRVGVHMQCALWAFGGETIDFLIGRSGEPPAELTFVLAGPADQRAAVLAANEKAGHKPRLRDGGEGVELTIPEVGTLVLFLADDAGRFLAAEVGEGVRLMLLPGRVTLSWAWEAAGTPPPATEHRVRWWANVKEVPFKSTTGGTADEALAAIKADPAAWPRYLHDVQYDLIVDGQERAVPRAPIAVAGIGYAVPAAWAEDQAFLKAWLFQVKGAPGVAATASGKTFMFGGP